MNFAADHPRIAIEDALEQAQAGATLVTASRRLARALSERANAMQQAGGREVWLAPAIVPWSAWLGELWNDLLFADAPEPPPVLLDENQERAFWERAIDADFLLQLGATAGAAADAWELMHAWRLDATAIEAYATEDAEAFLNWAREFESICRREGWLDAARATDFLAARLGDLRLPAQIILAGFDEFTPQRRSFLDACLRAGSQISIAEPAPEESPRKTRMIFESRAEEIEAAARWARSLVETGAAGIAVVFPDLAKIRLQVERAFSQLLDRSAFNISAGPALASYPLVSAALLALDLAPEGSEFARVTRLLRSMFLGGADAEWANRAALDAELRRFGGTRVSIARIERLARKHNCPQLVAILGRWRDERESAPAEQSPDGWARTFSTLLDRLKWPGDRTLESADYQTVEAWSGLLSDFARLGTVLPRMTYADALARLKSLAAAREYQPKADPAPVQILGLVDTSRMHFEHLWIGGLDDERWPRPPRPAPFLPIALQRLRGLPRSSPERELAFAQRVTSRLLASASDVVVSHAAHEGDLDLGPSPLIASIPAGEPALPDYASYLTLVRDSSLIECLEDHTAPPHRDATAPGGTRVFEFQSQCPFRAFAELRLAAKPLDAPAPGLSPMERGILVHHALASVWNALRSHAKLCACAEAELAAVVQASVSSAIGSIANYRGDALPEKFAALEQRRIERVIREWLEIERQRAPFTVVEFESERYAEAGGVRCKVRVDRVDRLDDGREVIIDYKTGRPAKSAWDGDRPDEPQLPLYAVSHSAPVAAVLFGQVKVGEAAFKGYAAEDDLVPGATLRDLETEFAEWRTVLDKLGADFRAGDARVDPKDANACRRCSLLALCRFTEAETPASAFDAKDANA